MTNGNDRLDEPTCRLSIGAVLLADGETSRSVLNRADQAMYARKLARQAHLPPNQSLSAPAPGSRFSHERVSAFSPAVILAAGVHHGAGSLPSNEMPVVVASRTDRAAISAILIDAFMEDPVLSWVFPDRARRRRWGIGFFDQHARRMIPGGCTWWTADAAAVWAAPGCWRDRPVDLLRLAAATLPGMWWHAPRVLMGLQDIESRHPRAPHLYLASVGVRQQCQGRGLGKAVLAPGLAYADDQRLPCYLESSNQQNVPLYERLGFAVTEKRRLPNGPPMWLMWRPAAEGPESA